MMFQRRLTLRAASRNGPHTFPLTLRQNQQVRQFALAGAAILVTIGCHLIPSSLSAEARWAIAILLSAVIYWSLSDLPDVVTGILATAALILSGAVSEASALRMLGHEFIWLLVISFAIGAIIRDKTLVEWCFARSGMANLKLPTLFAALTLFISATAFLIPSTSARAALLLPIFFILAHHATLSQRTALGLLFPTVILLSAGGSLIGAGAHALAAGYLEQHTGRKIDMVSWAALALPFAVVTTASAAATVYFAFIPREERASRLVVDTPSVNLDDEQRRALGIIGATILGWVTAPWHGVGMVVVGLIGLAVLLLPGIGCGASTKTAFKAVDVELLAFLATTFVLADALVRTGAGQALAAALLNGLPASFSTDPIVMAAMLAAIGLLAHLVITSRTARVSVLLPTVVLPAIGLGQDPTTLIMIAVLSTGFCQTLPVSAKPVSVFAGASPPPFGKEHLLKLSLLLLPQVFASLLLYACSAQLLRRIGQFLG